MLEDAEFLNKRLKLWLGGKLDALLKDTKAIQLRMQLSNQRRSENRDRRFVQLMMEGKVLAATRLITSSDHVSGVHKPTPDVINPPAEPSNDEALSQGEKPEVPDPVNFEGIDAKAIHMAAKSTFGSGGPTLIDAEVWRQLMCSNMYKADSERGFAWQ